MSEIIRGYTFSGEWTQATEGRWAHATKDGRDYFVKQYTMVAREPDETKIGLLYTKNSYDLKLAEFNKFRGRRERINNKLKTIAGSGGNIVIPLVAFVLF